MTKKPSSFDHLKRRLEQGITLLFEESGTEIGSLLDEPVTTSPLEPLSGVCPSCWIGAAAFHLADIDVTCQDIGESLEILQDKNDGWESRAEEIFSSLWGNIDDLRFHVFTFQLYGELIREAILRMDAGNVDAVPSHSSSDVISLPRILLFGAFSRFSAVTGLPTESLQAAASVMEELYSKCRLLHEDITSFSANATGDFRQLARCFANIQESTLSLATTLLRADVVSRSLMCAFPSQDDARTCFQRPDKSNML